MAFAFPFPGPASGVRSPVPEQRAGAAASGDAPEHPQRAGLRLLLTVGDPPLPLGGGPLGSLSPGGGGPFFFGPVGNPGTRKWGGSSPARGTATPDPPLVRPSRTAPLPGGLEKGACLGSPPVIFVRQGCGRCQVILFGSFVEPQIPHSLPIGGSIQKHTGGVSYAIHILSSKPNPIPYLMLCFIFAQFHNIPTGAYNCIFNRHLRVARTCGSLQAIIFLYFSWSVYLAIFGHWCGKRT